MENTMTGQARTTSPAGDVGTTSADDALTAVLDGYPAGMTDSFEGPAGGEFAPKGQVTPVYFMYDNSGSVHSFRHVFTQEHAAGRAFLRAQGEGSAVRAAVYGFDKDARQILAMCEIGDPSIGELRLSADGPSTDLTAPAELLLDVMRRDGRELQDAGYQVMRSLVIVITDGFDNHGRDYPTAWKTLREAPFGPIVMALGLQGAARAAITAIATEGLAFMAEDGHDFADQIREAIRFAFKTAVTFSKTAQAARGGTAQAPLPPTPGGFMPVGPVTY